MVIFMDPISNMLAIIKNGQAVNKDTVSFPFSKLKFEIAKILEKNNLVLKTERKEKKANKIIEMTLKYNEDKSPLISGLKKISKPGQRIYLGWREIKPVKSGYGLSIISTSKGLMTNKEARKKKLGGEVLCEVW